MKSKKLTSDEREAALIALIRQLLQGDLTEGQVLRALRRDVLGLSQGAYAELVDISRRTLSDIERDTGNASMATMNRAFRPLGLKLSVLPRQPALLGRLLAEDRDKIQPE